MISGSWQPTIARGCVRVPAWRESEGMESGQISITERLSLRTRPPRLPIMYQSWGDLLFMHWPVPAQSLRPLIPEPLAIDTHDGVAWIGITPFTMWGIRPVFAPALPRLSESHELNVRTYVHLDGVPGVWFFSLDANNRVAVLGARLAFHLPYFGASMSYERRDRTIRFTSRRPDRRSAPAEFEAAWRVGDELGEARFARFLPHRTLLSLFRPQGEALSRQDLPPSVDAAWGEPALLSLDNARISGVA